MNSSELHRKLLFCGYNDVTDYLRNSPVDRYIYKRLLVLHAEHKIDVPIMKIFSEIYYQCVRVQYDRNPGEDVANRYVREEEIWLDSRVAANFVLCVVWALFKRKKKISFHEDCFIQQLFPLIDGSEFMAFGKELIKFMKAEKIYPPYRFVTLPCHASEIPERIDLEYHTSMNSIDKLRNALSLPVESSEKDFNPWRRVTDDFSTKSIKWIITLYENREDQLGILERIEQACTKKEHQSRLSFFKMLRDEILAGDYVNMSIRYSHHNWGENYDPEVDYDYEKFPSWVMRTWSKEAEQTQRFLENIEAIIQQIDENNRCREMEHARKEAQYKSEIESLKAQLGLNAEKESASPIHTPQNMRSSKDISVSLYDLVTIVKDRFSKSGAEEVCTMLYHLALEHGAIDEATFKLIDDIVPAVIQRDKPQQTVEIPQAGQVNINPQQVINEITDKKS